MEGKVHPGDPSMDASMVSHSFVIQVPKEQIYRVPPPENAALFENYSRRRNSSSRRSFVGRRILRVFLISAAIIILLLAVAAAVFFLAVQPRRPSFSVTSLSGDDNHTMAFSVVILASNPNRSLRLRYLAGGAAAVSFSGVPLAGGAWPEFDQGTRNATAVDLSPMAGSGGVRLAAATQRELAGGPVAVTVDIRAPVEFRLGGVSSWKMTVRASCAVTVDKLAAANRVVSQDCKVRLS